MVTLEASILIVGEYQYYTIITIVNDAFSHQLCIYSDATICSITLGAHNWRLDEIKIVLLGQLRDNIRISISTVQVLL